jgi:hypothetical protein
MQTGRHVGNLDQGKEAGLCASTNVYARLPVNHTKQLMPMAKAHAAQHALPHSKAISWLKASHAKPHMVQWVSSGTQVELHHQGLVNTQENDDCGTVLVAKRGLMMAGKESCFSARGRCTVQWVLSTHAAALIWQPIAGLLGRPSPDFRWYRLGSGREVDAAGDDMLTLFQHRGWMPVCLSLLMGTSSRPMRVGLDTR